MFSVAQLIGFWNKLSFLHILSSKIHLKTMLSMYVGTWMSPAVFNFEQYEKCISSLMLFAIQVTLVVGNYFFSMFECKYCFALWFLDSAHYETSSPQQKLISKAIDRSIIMIVFFTQEKSESWPWAWNITIYLCCCVAGPLRLLSHATWQSRKWWWSPWQHVAFILDTTGSVTQDTLR